jgi:signal transduction histidine kinase
MFWINSQYDSSVVYFEKALRIREKLKNKENLASTLNNLGTVYYQWAIYDKAIEYYVKALDINKELKNNTGISLVKTNIGLVFQANKNPEKAIESYRESLVYAKASGELEPEAYAYNSLGQAFLKLNPDSAVYYFQKAYKLYVDADYLGGIMLSLQSLGQAYSIIKNWRKAEEYFLRSLKIAKERKVEMRIAESYKFLGIIEKNKKNFEPAKRYLLKSIKISEKSNLKELLRDCYKELSELNAESGNFEEAYVDLRRYLEFTTLIETEGVKRKLDELKNRFEYQHFEKRLLDEKYTNQKQQIILIASLIIIIIFGVMLSILLKYNRRIKNDYKLLSEKNEFIRKQKEELIGKNEKLDEINRGKDKLFSIIAHDLRNPFFGLINYSSMLKEEYAELSDEEKLEYISNLNKISQNTYNLLENLLHLSASRTGKIEFNPVNVTLSDVVMKSINLFSSQLEQKNIELTYSFENEQQAYCDENTVEIIIRNLLNNAIKYTNPGGHINVKCETSSEHVCIFIKDDGIGMDKETKSEIFSLSGVQSQKGTDGEKGTGLGLSLCYEFVKKNNGTIFFVSEPGKGSTFEVRLPKKVES